MPAQQLDTNLKGGKDEIEHKGQGGGNVSRSEG